MLRMKMDIKLTKSRTNQAVGVGLLLLGAFFLLPVFGFAGGVFTAIAPSGCQPQTEYLLKSGISGINLWTFSGNSTPTVRGGPVGEAFTPTSNYLCGITVWLSPDGYIFDRNTGRERLVQNSPKLELWDVGFDGLPANKLGESVIPRSDFSTGGSQEVYFPVGIPVTPNKKYAFILRDFGYVWLGYAYQYVGYEQGELISTSQGDLGGDFILLDRISRPKSNGMCCQLYYGTDIYFRAWQRPPSCDDMVRNQDETGVDCGGMVCQPCPSGGPCQTDRDCQFYCKSDKTCATIQDFKCPNNCDDTEACTVDQCIGAESNIRCEHTPIGSCQCSNGIQEANEADIDCGGVCGKKCVAGQKCIRDLDCEYGCDQTTKICKALCYTNSDCGLRTLNHRYCRENAIWAEYNDLMCSSPGTSKASCIEKPYEQLTQKVIDCNKEIQYCDQPNVNIDPVCQTRTCPSGATHEERTEQCTATNGCPGTKHYMCDYNRWNDPTCETSQLKCNDGMCKTECPTPPTSTTTTLPEEPPQPPASKWDAILGITSLIAALGVMTKQ